MSAASTALVTNSTRRRSGQITGLPLKGMNGHSAESRASTHNVGANRFA